MKLNILSHNIHVSWVVSVSSFLLEAAEVKDTVLQVMLASILIWGLHSCCICALEMQKKEYDYSKLRSRLSVSAIILIFFMCSIPHIVSVLGHYFPFLNY